MPKFFTDKKNIFDNYLRIVGEDVMHISKVLRMKCGEIITVCDGEGTDYEVSLKEFSKDYIIADILSSAKSLSEPSVYITLYQALPKQGKMESIIQKNTELGVSEFVPVYTKRCVVKPSDKTARWQKVAESAAKQSGRGIIPVVRDVISFNDAISEMADFDTKVILYEGEKITKIKEVVNEGCKKIAVMVGPEGGFEQEEVVKAVSKGIASVTLGTRILRTETAAAAVTPVILFIQGDV
ncbi:MAG: 16S rRNA (uracil(1498)-N(3))-methyltransferase [Clostridia bacterium]|nr:16S rRNA (uracil(1498)-N(3))-methyltransferase [Clostridia bacterium]MBQ4543336.1 16S rRNA (uracil(1498)-N(3))-methyltransferase [Clostridia bacterium]